MKTLTTLLVLLTFGTPLLALAEDPPPLPPNPFQNLPSNPQAGFDPFADEDEDANFGNVPPPSGVRVGEPSTGFAPRTAGSVPATGASKVSYEDPSNSKAVVESFDYPDAEIIDVAKAISRLTGKNFIYDASALKGKISITSETPITVGEAWNAFLAALNMKSFALIPSGKHYRIERSASAKEKQTPVVTDPAVKNEELVTQLIQLRYISAGEAETAFRFFLSRDALVRAFTQTNTLIITDTATNIDRLKQLLNHLDVAGHQESLMVIQIRYAAAKDIAKLIGDIISDQGSTRSGSFGTTAPATTINTRTNNRNPKGGSTISRIIADDRTNSLIVKANAAGLSEIRALVRRLDTKTSPGEGSGRIHVVRLQFADAETLAKTLSGFTQNSAQNRARTTSFPTPFGGDQSVFQGAIQVSAEKLTQSLVITASPADFQTLKKVIETLDVPRDQVFVQAHILEMRLNRDNSAGTSFVSAGNGIALPSASGNLTTVLSGNPLGVGGLVLGFKKGLERPSVEVPDSSGNKKTFKFNSVNGLIEFIQGNTDSNVIATPNITALDNEDAEVEISETIKVPVTNTASNGTQTQSFQDDKAQLLLKVKPQINKASNFVKLDITQKLENFDSSQVPRELQGKTQGRNTRQTTTKVIVQNEDTVVLSGLIRDSVNEITNKVPILGDIPILGWLFKNTKAEVRKTNLLVFITPTIIKQYDAMRKVLKDRLTERKEFVEEFYGSKDPFARKLAKIESQLPDLHVITPMPKTSAAESTSISTPSSPDRDDEQAPSPWDIPPPPAPWNNQPTFDGAPPGEAVDTPPPPPPPMDGGEF
ncbi:MAG: type II secretion system secretin GspD [Bdellovibrionales bacterium]|nr:type II secretion system secretin GspD [Bdellovibrionales bacterium]